MAIEVVLDASALLAYLHGETGGDQIPPMLARAAVSAANWSEVVQKMLHRGTAGADLRATLESAGLVIMELTADDAERAARLWHRTRSRGLSLGDRCCLALAQRLRAPAITAERLWSQLDLGIPVQLIR